MKEILGKFLGCAIGVNIDRPLVVESVQLIGVAETFFTVKREKEGNVYHVPFVNIVKVTENSDGVVISALFKHAETFPLVVKIGHVVAYTPS